jgi:hypothetical protein
MTNQDYLQAVQFLNEALARRPRPDCLICGNDRVALVAYQHLLSVGLSTSLSVHGKGFLLGWLCHGLPVDGNSGNTKWVLVVNVNPSADDTTIDFTLAEPGNSISVRDETGSVEYLG